MRYYPLSRTSRFDDDVAWLRFLNNWESRASGPPLTTSERDKLMLRIAFDWAREHPRAEDHPIKREGGQDTRYYTLSREDIGIAHLAAFGRLWPVRDFMGRILPGDVGKRVHQCDGVLQVENDEQRTARTIIWPYAACQALHNHNTEEYDAEMAAPRCQCPTGCGLVAVMHLFSVRLMVHETPIYDSEPTVFCDGCGDKALASGAFVVGEDVRSYTPTTGPVGIDLEADAEKDRGDGGLGSGRWLGADNE